MTTRTKEEKNAQRVKAAKAAIDAHCLAKDDSISGEDTELRVLDLISDCFHLLHSEGIGEHTIDGLHRQAKRNLREEITE